MARGLTTANQNAIAAKAMWRRWLLESGDIRICSLDHIEIDKRVYLPEKFSVELTNAHGAKCIIEDTEGYYENEFEVDSIAILSMAFGPKNDVDSDVIVRGYVSSSPKKEGKIELEISPGGYTRFPNDRFNNQNGSHHSPPNGARVVMPDGVVVLTSG